MLFRVYPGCCVILLTPSRYCVILANYILILWLRILLIWLRDNIRNLRHRNYFLYPFLLFSLDNPDIVDNKTCFYFLLNQYRIQRTRQTKQRSLIFANRFIAAPFGMLFLHGDMPSRDRDLRYLHNSFQTICVIVLVSDPAHPAGWTAQIRLDVSCNC